MLHLPTPAFAELGPGAPRARCALGLLLLVLLAGCTPDEREQAATLEKRVPSDAATGPAAPPPESEWPSGMVYVPGGTTLIGSENGRPAERPVFEAEVAPFFMDRHPVTVARFRRFVDATGYETEAERFGNAGVFDLEARRWRLVDGADWTHPRGPEAPPAPEDHPVTQVSWNDATAYCAWAGKRLPTEIEWEHAARAGRNARQRYAWGSRLVEGGAYRANTWQGTFPTRNTAADGYRYTSPVGAFGETPLGLTDMGGNVWEWTASGFRPYPLNGAPEAAAEKVQRGGSFLCHPSYCHGYRVSARSHSTPETSLFHVGFRCVKDVASR